MGLRNAYVCVNSTPNFKSYAAANINDYSASF